MGGVCDAAPCGARTPLHMSSLLTWYTAACVTPSHDLLFCLLFHAALTRLELSNCPVTNQGLGLVSCGATPELPGPCLQRLGIDGCRCSMLGVAAALGAHKGVSLWQPTRDHMPRWVQALP
jgi:hypothetical protein